MKTASLHLLKSLLAQPTAPFREHHVSVWVQQVLREHAIPCFLDPIGNVVVGCGSRAAYLRQLKAPSREPLRVFIAHMDHPGFHGVRWLSKDRLRVQWHGGSPVSHLAGAPVWLGLDEGGYVAEGRLTRARLIASRRAIDRAEVRLTTAWNGARPDAERLYGGFRFRRPVWQAGRRLYTKAADDLVGVFAIVQTALDHRARFGDDAPFVGLLTRAEEVGFVGAIGHFELGWLARATRPVVCISLETSRTLPGALIGRGPVVRLGDRRTVFDAGLLNVLAGVAARRLPGAYQRRVMDGGTCEATAAIAYGLRAIGISVPLGNYHNESFEGGPDARGSQGPAPEFVHLDDVRGLLELCAQLVRPGLAWHAPWSGERRNFQKRLRTYRRLL